MFTSEMNGYNSRLYYLFTKYKQARIKKYFDLNLLEFLSLPREQIEWIFNLALEFEKEENQQNKEIMANLTEPKK